jgi:uncharacterized protein YkwD
MTFPRLSLFFLLSTLIVLASGQGTIRGGDRMAALPEEAESLHDRSLATTASNSETSTNPAASFATTGASKQYCIRADNRTYALSNDEHMNVRWMNQARAAKGLRNMRYDADLVVEAQRWAKYLASKRTVALRDNIFRNVFCGTSNEMGEYVMSTSSVSKTGAFASLMQGDGSEYILYPPYDRVGLGIAKAGSTYYMVMLFKDHV